MLPRSYLEVQLRLARRMAELTGAPVSQTARNYTNFHRRLGLGDAHDPAEPLWARYAGQLDQLPGLDAQVAWTEDVFKAAKEGPALPGRTWFGCFACEAPTAEGAVRIHFTNRDTDETGGPLVRAKFAARTRELAALVRHVRETHPQSIRIQGGSWLYHLEAYRRLFPADYAASRTPWPGRISLTGTSSWGQIIDSRGAVRDAVRDILVANLEALDPEAPWRAFPYPVLSVTAPIDSFYRHFGV